MVTTGWKSPLNARQYGYHVNGENHKCYLFSPATDAGRRLPNLTKNDNTSWVYIPTSGGIKDTHASPYVYCDNYNFNIPSNATIDKVYVIPIVDQGNGERLGKVVKLKTVKLKTNNAYNDTGVGNNLANDEFIDKLRMPIKNWTNIDFFRKAGVYMLGGQGASVWGVNLTPAIVNSPTFGCVLQFIGTGTWVMPRIARILMGVDYTIPTEKTTDAENIPSEMQTHLWIDNTKVSFDKNSTSTTTFKLDLDSPSASKKLKVQFIHKGKSRQSPGVKVESNNLVFGPHKNKTYTFPTISFTADATEKEYVQSVDVYPAFTGGEQILTVFIYNYSRYIKFNIDMADYDTMTTQEKEKYGSTGQYCKITNTWFHANYAGKRNEKDECLSGDFGRGGAMFITTEHFKRKGNKYGDDAENLGKNHACSKAPNLCWNGRPYVDDNTPSSSNS